MWNHAGPCPLCGRPGGPILWDGMDSMTGRRTSGVAMECDCDEWPDGITDAEMAVARSKGEARRRRRVEARVTLSQAAEAAGVGAVTMSRYEQGKCQLERDQQIALNLRLAPPLTQEAIDHITRQQEWARKNGYQR